MLVVRACSCANACACTTCIEIYVDAQNQLGLSLRLGMYVRMSVLCAWVISFACAFCRFMCFSHIFLILFFLFLSIADKARIRLAPLS